MKVHEIEELREQTLQRRYSLRSLAPYARDVVIGLLVVALFAAAAGLYYFQRFEIRSESMEPTLRVGETVWSHRVMTPPDRGDIVAFPNPADPTGSEVLIKRVIGLPGEHVEAHSGSVYVNYGMLDESVWVPSPEVTASFDALRVPDGHVFVMGDNRDRSSDSRSFGTVAIEEIDYLVVGQG